MAEVELISTEGQQAQVVVAVPGVQGPIGSNIPAGGSAQQVLFKQTASDFDFSWKLITNSNVDAAAAIAGTKISPSFGSQNLSTTGTVTGASFIPTSSTVPSNGLYLPATNQLGVAINSAERLRIDSSGRILLGTDTALGVGTGTQSLLLIESVSGSIPVAITRNSVDTTGPVIAFGKSRGTSAGDLTTVSNGDVLGELRFAGADGITRNSIGATIQAKVDNTVASGSVPTCITFNVTASGGTNPTERMRIDDLGNVGIGATAPSTLLHLSSNTGSAAPIPAEMRIETRTAASDWSTTSPWGRIGFYNADTSGGGAKNHIVLDAVAAVATGSVSNLSISCPNGTTADLVERLKLTYDGSLTINAASGKPPSIWTLAGSEVARIDTGGRLLVGTSSFITNDSNSVIQAAGSTRGADLVLGSSPASGIVTGNLIGLFRCFGNAGGTYQECGRISVIADGPHALNDKPGALTFSVTSSGASTVSERMRIDSMGRVGIGTNSPQSVLHVAGTTRIGPDSAVDAVLEVGAGATGNRNAYIDIVGDTTYTDYGLRIIRANGGADTVSQLKHRGLGGFQVITEEAAPIAFLTSSTERVRIDSSGRFLLGTSTALGIGTSTTAQALIESAGTSNTQLGLVRNTADTSGAILILGKSRGTSAGSVTAAIADDVLGQIRFAGADGTSRNSNGAYITCQVDGTPALNDMPGRLVFLTTASGSASPVEQVRIASDGTFAYRQSTPATASTSSTLTVDNLKTKIITSAPASGVTLTLPSGGLLETSFGTPYTGIAFDWSIINTSASNAITLAANTGHTIVGSGGVSANISARFATRRSGINTFVSYRLS